jgi:murein hydrolase activator
MRWAGFHKQRLTATHNPNPRQHEADIIRKTEGLDRLKQQQSDHLAEWNARRTQIGGSLSALVRLAAVPPSASMMQETGTTERLRSAFVLRTLIPRLQQRAELLRQDLANIRKAAEAVTAGQAALVKANEALERRLQQAERLAAHKNVVLAARQDDLARATATANRQARSAQDIRELLARLDDGRKARTATIAAERRRRAAIAARAGTLLPAEPKAPLRLVGLEKQQGGLLLPVSGKVERRFGEGNDAFTHGISITAARDAPVLAPADGRVRYAGEFQNYGLVLIMDHGGGFHSVIAGLERVNAATGQWVLAGEPLARVAPHGSLYVEIRKDGRPVDPLQWFTVGRS